MNRRTLLACCAGAIGTLAGCLGDDSDDGGAMDSPGSPGKNGPPRESDTDAPTDLAPLDGDWRSYQHDAGNSGSTDAAGPVEEPATAWTRPTLTGGPAVAPAATEDAFVVVARSGAVYALAADDGRVAWRGGVDADPTVGAVATDGTVVLATAAGVVGLDAEDGEERWQVETGTEATGLAARDDLLVVATGEGLLGLSPEDGAERWRQTLDASVTTAPAVGDDLVAVGVEGGVLAVDAGDGSVRWRTPVGDGLSFPPAVADGTVSVATGSELVALDGGDGGQAWSVDAGAPIAAAPLVADDRVVVPTVTTDVDPPSAGDGADGTTTGTPADVEFFRATLVGVGTDGAERWRASAVERYNFTSGPPEHLPTLVAGDAVVADLDGQLYAVEAETGAERWSTHARGPAPAATAGVVSTGVDGVTLADGGKRWRFRSGEGVSSAPAVVGNTVYVGSDDNHCYALAANGGDLRWATQLDDVVRAAPAVGPDAVYVGTLGGTLYALDREDGRVRWHVSLGGDVRSPTLHDGTLYVGTFSSTLYAIDAADGSERWRTTVDAQRFVAMEVAVVDGAVVAGENGDLRAFETADGSERWRFQVGDESVQSPPVAAGGRVYVGVDDRLRALDAADGSAVWTYSLDDTANDPPVVTGEAVHVATDTAVHAVDVTDGSERWRQPVGDRLRLVASADALYGWGYDTPLLALDPADGSQLWSGAGVSPRSPLAVADGYLFVGDETGAVRALGSGGG